MSNVQADQTTELKKLRTLLLEPEQQRIGELEHRLETPELLARDLQEALPPAVRLAKKQPALVGSLKPVFEEIMKKSVIQDPSKMIDILYPVIGPTVRKAVNEAFSQLTQAINQTMESSFSWNSLKWRWEAWRSGKSYAEIVLYHKLVYRVEQIFLVHKASGLLLLHVVCDPRMKADAHLVSSMFTAIQDFVQQSFHSDQPMSTVELGDVKAWLADGPHAYMAVVGRGQLPESLRTVMAKTLEDVHQNKLEEFRNFKGNTDAFLDSELTLRQCMRARMVPPKKPTGAFAFLGTALVALALWFGATAFDRAYRGNQLREALHAEPGIWLSEAVPEGDGFRVRGLRDHLARSVIASARGNGYSGPLFDDTEPYYSLDGPILLRRTRDALRPVPAHVQFSIHNASVVVISGDAEAAWVRKAARLTPPLGVTRIDTQELYIMGTRPLPKEPEPEPLTEEPKPVEPEVKPATLPELLDLISLSNVSFQLDDSDLNDGQKIKIKRVVDLVTQARAKASEQDQALLVDLQALVPEESMRLKMIGFHKSQKVKDHMAAEGIPKTTISIARASQGPEGSDPETGVVIFKVSLEAGGER